MYECSKNAVVLISKTDGKKIEYLYIPGQKSNDTNYWRYLQAT